MCPKTPKFVAQVVCYAQCQFCVRCLVGYKFRISPISDPGFFVQIIFVRPRIPYIEEAKMVEGIVYGAPIKSPEAHCTITKLLLL